MKKISEFPRDKDGIPRLDRQDIEAKAEQVIELVDASVLARPTVAPLGQIASWMKGKSWLTFSFDQDLGFGAGGGKILGKFRISPRAIFIDRMLPANSPRWLFTLAHELGHFVLHHSLRIARSGLANEKNEITDTGKELGRLRLKPRTAREWLEWQANTFAASLLMPRRTFPIAARAAMRAAAMRPTDAVIFVDDQQCNIVTLKRVVAELRGTFLTSRKSTEIRLKELNLLDDRRSRGMPHIVDLLREDDE